jgi:L-ascorbate metabolism protein UlaG (beta-lactamase superfamily)
VIGVAACSAPPVSPHHVTVPTMAVAAPADGVAAQVADDEITVSWIGHATCLIGINGHFFLTDPVFSERIGWFVRRNYQPAMRPDEMPKLDAILISHAHMDHLDFPSLRALAAVPLFIPPGVKHYLPDDLPQHPVYGVETWGSWHQGDVTITAVPAQHEDDRFLIDGFWHSHTGWVIQVGNRTVYFAGDTGYVPAYAQEIGRRFHIDVALIPVGPAGRAKWIERSRANVHAHPDAAMQLFKDTHAQWMVPIHYGMFFQKRGWERPFLDAAIQRAGLERWVRVLDIGETARFLY